MGETLEKKPEAQKQIPAEGKPVSTEKVEAQAEKALEKRAEGDKEKEEAGRVAEEKAKEVEEDKAEKTAQQKEAEIKWAQEIADKYKDHSEEKLAALTEEEKKQLEEAKKILEEAKKQAESGEAEGEKEGWLGKIEKVIAGFTAALGALIESITKLFERTLAKIGINFEGKEKGREIIVKSPLGENKQLKVSSWPGVRNAPEAEKGKGSENHDGVDIAIEENTELFAGVTGKIVAVGEDKEAGKYIKIELPDGRKITYAHLNGIIGKKGDEVKPETKIGLTGKTGISTAPHLHIGLETKDGVHINPLQLFGNYLEKAPDEAKQKEIAQYFESRQKPASSA